MNFVVVSELSACNPFSSCSFFMQNSIALIIAATLSTTFVLGWLAFYIWLHVILWQTHNLQDLEIIGLSNLSSNLPGSWDLERG